jgi:hypothetical protein
MNNNFNSLIIPLKVLRPFLTFGVDNIFNPTDDLNEKNDLSNKYVSVVFNLVLGWCGSRFNW